MVKKTKKEKEKGILDAFINSKPDFAGGPLFCRQCENDPPDFICENDKRRIGIELGEWLHRDQTTRSRALEDIEREIKEKILSDATITDFLKKHDIIIFPIANKFPSKLSKSNFISTLIDFLKEFIITSKLKQKEYFINDFNCYPDLKQFITGIFIHQSRISGVIEFAKGGAYSADDALEALLKLINDKINSENYKDLKSRLGLSEFHLIIYYNMALIYNTPLAGVENDIHSIVELVKKELAKNHGPFDKIFLFIALDPGMEVFTLYT